MLTSEITDVQHLNYWERLHILKLYSIQDDVNVIKLYIFGRLHNIYMVSNIDGTIRHIIKSRNHSRHETQVL